MPADRCSAHRRDGQPCGAPAIPFGTVCLRHGGAAPQVKFAAERTRRQMALFDAVEDWRAAQGTDRAFDLLCKVSAAERSLEEYEGKLRDLSRLRAAVRAAEAARQG